MVAGGTLGRLHPDLGVLPGRAGPPLQRRHRHHTGRGQLGGGAADRRQGGPLRVPVRVRRRGSGRQLRLVAVPVVPVIAGHREGDRHRPGDGDHHRAHCRPGPVPGARGVPDREPPGQRQPGRQPAGQPDQGRREHGQPEHRQPEAGDHRQRVPQAARRRLPGLGSRGARRRPAPGDERGQRQPAGRGHGAAGGQPPAARAARPPEPPGQSGDDRHPGRAPGRHHRREHAREQADQRDHGQVPGRDDEAGEVLVEQPLQPGPRGQQHADPGGDANGRTEHAQHQALGEQHPPDVRAPAPVRQHQRDVADLPAGGDRERRPGQQGHLQQAHAGDQHRDRQRLARAGGRRAAPPLRVHDRVPGQQQDPGRRQPPAQRRIGRHPRRKVEQVLRDRRLPGRRRPSPSGQPSREPAGPAPRVDRDPDHPGRRRPRRSHLAADAGVEPFGQPGRQRDLARRPGQPALADREQARRHRVAGVEPGTPGQRDPLARVEPYGRPRRVGDQPAAGREQPARVDRTGVPGRGGAVRLAPGRPHQRDRPELGHGQGRVGGPQLPGRPRLRRQLGGAQRAVEEGGSEHRRRDQRGHQGRPAGMPAGGAAGHPQRRPPP